MTPKALKDQLKMGNVDNFQIEKRDGQIYVFFYLRRNPSVYKLDRFFPSINSAVNYLVKAIDKPVFEGLHPEWRSLPPITIRSFDNRGYYEKDKHEQTAEQEAV